jgi:cytochrome bd-type quinol oxidase subunit 2
VAPLGNYKVVAGNNMKQITWFLVIFGSIFFFNIAEAGLLQGNTATQLTNNMTVVQEKAGYDPNVTVGLVVAGVIKTFLALLGVIFVVLIVVAGYNWMTAAGEEEKINKAKDTIKSAIIGLIIIVAAYAITYFVFENLPGSGDIHG